MMYKQHPSADLHIHTKYSDSTNSVEKVISLAQKKKLRAISITDHDTVAALDEARALATNSGLEIIPGIEFSSRWNDVSVHLLGYFMDYHDPELVDYLKLCEKRRVARAEEMVQKLQNLGFDISMEKVMSIADGGVLGRPHVAEAVMQVSQYSRMHEVFRDLLVYGKPAYVPKPTFSSVKIIELLHSVGGICSLAHPKTVGDDTVIPVLADAGLDAIEVVHSSHSLRDVEKYSALADEYDLVLSGGSDSHGKRLGREALGRFTISMEQVDRLRAKVHSRNILYEQSIQNKKE